MCALQVYTSLEWYFALTCLCPIIPIVSMEWVLVYARHYYCCVWGKSIMLSSSSLIKLQSVCFALWNHTLPGGTFCCTIYMCHKVLFTLIVDALSYRSDHGQVTWHLLNVHEAVMSCLEMTCVRDLLMIRPVCMYVFPILLAILAAIIEIEACYWLSVSEGVFVAYM